MALGRKTGGRKKGSKNRTREATKAALAKVKVAAPPIDEPSTVPANACTPLEFMLRVLADEAQKPAIRLQAAKDAAPYVHPKLAQVEMKLKGDKDAPIEIRATMTPDEAAREYLRLVSGSAG